MLPPAAGNDVREATGYLGEQVVLKLDVNLTWNLTSIRWSIYDNVTLIASFQHGELQLIRNRFSLNTTSGDLTITNLMANDALKYRVVLDINGKDDHTIYVQLSVRGKFNNEQGGIIHSL